MKRWVLAAIVLAATSGCKQADFNEEKAASQKRWFAARSKVLYRLAEDRFSMGQLDAAMSSARQAVALAADHHDAKLLVAKILIEQGKYTEAIRDLKQACQGKPDSAETFYLLGVAQEKGGRLAEALDSYERAQKIDPLDLASVKAQAEVLVAMGQAVQAQVYIDSFLPKAGEDPGIYELAGRLAAMNQDFGRAADCYRHACDLDYRNIRYAEALARSQVAAGRHAEGAETLRDLMRREDYKPVASIWRMLGDCYEAAGKHAQAFDAYFTLTEKTPDDASAWTALAGSALGMRDAPRAILSARKALRLAPDDVDATLVLGYALLRDRQVPQAVEVLSRAVQAHPNHTTVRCLLGRAHAAAGNTAEANRCYAEALKADPNSHLARELLAAGDREVSRAD